MYVCSCTFSVPLILGVPANEACTVPDSLLCSQVWSLRVDLHVLDYCGNIIDCAAIAAIAALKHFRCVCVCVCVCVLVGMLI